MGRIERRLIRYLKRYFGPLGGLYLIREMKKLKYYDIDALEDDEKLKLIDALIKNVFSKALSPNKRLYIWSKLLSMFELSPETMDKINKELKEKYDLGVE